MLYTIAVLVLLRDLYYRARSVQHTLSSASRSAGETYTTVATILRTKKYVLRYYMINSGTDLHAGGPFGFSSGIAMLAVLRQNQKATCGFTRCSDELLKPQHIPQDSRNAAG